MKKLLVSMTIFICALLAIFMHPSASYGANEGGTPSPSAVSIRATTTSMPTWTKTLFAKKSTVYNNRLALKAAEMCNSSYGISNKGIKAKFDEYGLDDYKPYNYRFNYYRDGGFTPGDNTAAFMVGHDTLKINGSNAIVLVVVMRGTQTIREQVGDWGKGGEKAFLGTKVWNNVNDFYRSVNDGVDEYVKSHGRITRAAKSGKLKVLITGHSLGGAAANMYAAHLNHSASKRVPGWKGFLKKGDIYAYTFGAIKVLTRNVNIAYGYENIHNIYNKYDSFGPNGAKSRFKASHPKAKFGHTDIFDIGKKDESSVNLLGNPNHDVTTYIEALNSGKVSCSSSTYKVTFNGNVIGGTKSSSQTIRWGKTTKLKANNFKALGYKFIGWNTKPNGKGKSYGNKSNVKNLAKPYDSIVLFAQWKKVPTFKVVFSANGGKGTMKAQVFNRGESVALKANTFKRTGYKFVGWNTKANGKGQLYKNKAKVKNLAKPGKSIRLYAQWKKLPPSWGGKLKAVAADAFQSAAIQADGSLWMRGSGVTSSQTDSSNGKMVPIRMIDGVSAVSVGRVNVAAIKKDGSLWMWGSNVNGELGIGNHKDINHFVKVLDGVASVSLGDYHAAAVKKDGSLWMWGDGGYGQLGNKTCKDSTSPIKIMDNVASVSLGCFHSAAVKKDGSLWMWGSNTFGQLGRTSGSTVPVKVMDNVASVSLGCFHSAAVKKDGSLWMWGSNINGQLGSGALEYTTSFTPIKVMDNVVSVSLGDSHSAAVKKDGGLWMWGVNHYGQLGDGTTIQRNTPIKVMDGVATISLGEHISFATKKDGSTWAWGDNYNGLLLDGTATNRSSPVRIG